jgi:hypothetical protein
MSSLTLRKLLPFKLTFFREQASIGQRALAFLKQQSRDLDTTSYPVDEESLRLALQEYMFESFEETLSYGPFKDIVLSPLTVRSLLMNESQQDESHQEANIPTSNQNRNHLRKRYLALSTHVYSYEGIARFVRKNDSNPDSIPSENKVQIAQLNSFDDMNSDFLPILKSKAPQTGLSTIVNIEAKTLSISPPATTTGPATDSSSGGGVDIIIVIAVSVAACSMVLLAFAVYLAFRRRRANQAGYRQHSHDDKPEKAPSIQAKLTEESDSPASKRSQNSPPVIEIHNDKDNMSVSDYTESVFSAPIGNGGSGYMSKWVPAKGNVKPSSFLSPKYINSSEKKSPTHHRGYIEDSGVEQDEMAGVPPLSTPQRNELNYQKYQQKNSLSPSSHQNRGRAESSGDSSLGLYPDSQINQDIRSSLEAYGKHLSHVEALDDGHSISSVESYGFSLDGVGDNSTLANSTRYGY